MMHKLFFVYIGRLDIFLIRIFYGLLVRKLKRLDPFFIDLFCVICVRRTKIVGIKPKLWNKRPGGVNVMITIFCDFCQFSAQKILFFSKNNVKNNSLQRLAVHSLRKNAIFGEKSQNRSLQESC
jgi:hypothetical protein